MKELKKTSVNTCSEGGKGVRDHLDLPKMVLLFGPMAGIVGMIGNLVLEGIMEDYPVHYTAEMVFSDVDWEDWRDFLKLNRREDE